MSKDLFLALYKSERESEIDDIIKNNCLDEEKYWIPYGNKDSNFSVIGNQASNAERALIEKLTNSVDAVLMRRCYEENIDPRGINSPSSPQEAIRTFFDIKNGDTSFISTSKEKELSENIMLIATNKDCETTPRNSKFNPNLIIFDSGEGQSPKKLPETILSLLNGNKKGISFTQGNYNQGGSGALMYCGDKGYCLVISKRNINIPNKFIDENDDTIHLWGWTLIRKEIRDGYKDPVYTYYAPNGRVPTFYANELELLPKQLSNSDAKVHLEYDGPCAAYIPYENKVSSGTAIKLYNYKVDKKGPINSHIKYDLATHIYDTYLPIRFIDCRKNKSSNSVIFRGFKKIIEDDLSGKADDTKGLVYSKLGLDFMIDNQKVDVTIYCCNKRKSSDLTASKLIENSRPIKFCLGQQFQGGLTARFLNNAGLGIIQDLVIIIVEFPNITTQFKSDLFMTDRERLYDKRPKKEIEKRLKDYILNSQELKEFSEYIFKSEVKDEKEASSSVKEVVEEWIQKDPTIMNVLLGSDIPKTDLKNKSSKGEDHGEIKPKKRNGKTKDKDHIETSVIPNYFDPLLKKDELGIFTRDVISDTSFRLRFETDAEENFFRRSHLKGEIKIQIDGEVVTGFSKSIYNGIATLVFDKKIAGKKNKTKELDYEVYLDEKLLFHDVININIKENKQEHSGEEDKDTGALGLPEYKLLDEENWISGMNEESGVLYKSSFEKNIFFINIDNKYLKAKKAEYKDSSSIAEFYEQLYIYAMLFTAMSVKNSEIASTKQGNDEALDISEQIEYATKIHSKVFFITEHLTSQMKKKLKM